MESRMTKRLNKDLQAINKNYADLFKVTLPTNDIRLWHVDFEGAKGTVYEGENFRLRFRFSANYPIESPEVVFVGKPPDHEHVYSNGFICLSILYDEWSAALTVASICISVLSMLSSAERKVKPPNDDEFVKRSMGKGPKDFKWSFHDQKC